MPKKLRFKYFNLIGIFLIAKYNYKFLAEATST